MRVQPHDLLVVGYAQPKELTLADAKIGGQK